MRTTKHRGSKVMLEIISAEATILSAIHKIKANKGSGTPGTDGQSLRDSHGRSRISMGSRRYLRAIKAFL